MAFLDNSGDIILDAVLTEVGRRRMANGTFNVRMFALGDDEINYKLYNKSHPSGSAYYDLEILQTPILEAFTETNAGINYGLLSHGNTNLMYMPVIKDNELVPESAKKSGAGFYYLAVNDGLTADAITSALGGNDSVAPRHVLKSGASNGTKIMSEIGLDTKEIAATPENTNNFLDANNLSDRSVAVSVDTRFIAAVMGPTNGSVFANNGGEGREQIQVGMGRVMPSGRDRNLSNHRVATVRAMRNQVYFRQNDNRSDTSTSVMGGPRCSAVALNFAAKTITDSDFSRYGKLGQNLFADGNTYNYIDTTVYVTGQSSGATQQINLRIIKKA
jgi:hypothetical protein